jgi:transcription elongation factor GreB
MSKAFTRESDDGPEEPLPVRSTSVLPPGAKNYLTPDGAKRLREELDRLLEGERPRTAVGSIDSEARQRLLTVDQRIRWIRACLHTAVVTGRPAANEDRIRFGALVTVRESSGVESSYRIVGVDETDIERGWVSWVSPIAKALLNMRRGQRVKLKLPLGEEELEIVAVSYDETV